MLLTIYSHEITFCDNSDLTVTAFIVDVTTLCHVDEMVVYIAKRYVDNQRFTFIESSCTHTENETHIILKTKFDECRTTMVETRDKIIYQNIAMNRLHPEEGNLITRDNIDEIIVKCSIYKMQNSSRSGSSSGASFNVTAEDVLYATEGLFLVRDLFKFSRI